MLTDVTVSLPVPIYEIYADAAKRLKVFSVEEVLAGALQAYAQYLFEEMMRNGELQEKHG